MADFPTPDSTDDSSTTDMRREERRGRLSFPRVPRLSWRMAMALFVILTAALGVSGRASFGKGVGILFTVLLVYVFQSLVQNNVQDTGKKVVDQVAERAADMVSIVLKGKLVFFPSLILGLVILGVMSLLGVFSEKKTAVVP